MARFELLISSEPIAGTAAEDHAISRRLLDSVARAELAGALRIWRPVPALALTRLDELRPGAAAARALAKNAGLDAVRRLSGGHAVVLGAGSVCVGVAEPAGTFAGLRERYARLRDAISAAFAELSIVAEYHALDGEWCPGAWSIRSGPVKLAGLAQRAIKGGAWIEAVLELGPDPAARALLQAVYSKLELPLDVATLGSVSELAGSEVTFEQLAGALRQRLRSA